MNSNPNIYLGLNEAQVNARKRKGQVNYDTTVPTKSYKQIIYGTFLHYLMLLTSFQVALLSPPDHIKT